MSAGNVKNINNDLDNDLMDDETIDDMYLTFHLGAEVYGVGIGYVTEIVGIQNITEVPDMPSFVKGVVNLRGQVIPVVDMRLKFGMENKEYDERTCIVVVNINDIQLGLVVDTVSEVMTIEKDLISAPPKIAKARSSQYIKGLGKIGDDVKILLDGEKLLYDEELNQLA